MLTITLPWQASEGGERRDVTGLSLSTAFEDVCRAELLTRPVRTLQQLHVGQARKLCCGADGMPLRLVELCGHGDDNSVDRRAQVAQCLLHQVLEECSKDLLWAEQRLPA